MFFHVGFCFVKPIPVGRFTDNVISLREWIGFTQYFVIGPPNIPAKKQLLRGKFATRIIFANSQANRRAAEQVSRIRQQARNFLTNHERLSVLNGTHLGECPPNIVFVVQSFQLGLIPAAATLIDSLKVALLNSGTIHQHDLAKINSGRRGVNRPFESLSNKPWNKPGVIDVGVGKHHIIHLIRIEAKLLVKLIGVDTLKQSTIQQNLNAGVGGNKVFAPCDGAGCTKKLNSHL
jgi:hypothetical protein